MRREGDKLISPSEDSYTHAKDFVEGTQAAKSDSSTSRYRDHRERSQKHVVCRNVQSNEYKLYIIVNYYYYYYYYYYTTFYIDFKFYCIVNTFEMYIYL